VKVICNHANSTCAETCRHAAPHQPVTVIDWHCVQWGLCGRVTDRGTWQRVRCEEVKGVNR
jgi:hypothetical protein